MSVLGLSSSQRTTRWVSILAALACAMFASIATRAARLPTGFAETRVATGLASPTAMFIALDVSLAPDDGSGASVPIVSANMNSITGPRTFSLDASVARTFRVNNRLNLDWRIDATNVLNRVTYSGINALITSPQFGFPNRTNEMRKIRTNIRMRF